MNVKELQAELRAFAQERDWEQFHSPKNLTMALAAEAAELLEIFQWLSEEESADLSEPQRQAAADEIADVQIYLVRLADRLNIDLASAVANKMTVNRAKYPADLVRGSARKYTEYAKSHDDHQD